MVYRGFVIKKTMPRGTCVIENLLSGPKVRAGEMGWVVSLCLLEDQHAQG